MAPDKETSSNPLEFLGHIKVIKDGSVLGIMIYKDRFLTRLKASKPVHALFGNQGWSHPHVRAAIAPYEPPTSVSEIEMVVTEHLPECVTTALRPFGVMIAGHDVVLVLQGIEHGFDRPDLLIRTEIGDISTHQDEIKVRQCVDIPYAPADVTDRHAACRIVQVGQERYLKRTLLSDSDRQGQQAG